MALSYVAVRVANSIDREQTDGRKILYDLQI
jgi:hypothetical protein